MCVCTHGAGDTLGCARLLEAQLEAMSSGIVGCHRNSGGRWRRGRLGRVDGNITKGCIRIQHAQVMQVLRNVLHTNAHHNY